ncbi:MAG: RagB/SusD family nutrient uptake outer membrane protein [Bacteroidales bacterium]|nr:RagB/SusD family nutrient uptake outer membrane protein [Bacteroidales bacterium]MCF8389349.1 RagB/SusD family nutrient uptake outer membrane protein [Bacteroidales bacterium]
MIKRIAIFIITVFIFSTSCNKDDGGWLELIPPDGLVQDEYWKTKQHVVSTLMGAYQQLTKMDEELFLFGEIRGGLVALDNNAPDNLREIMRGDLTSTNKICDWSGFYKTINYCNLVLHYNQEVYENDTVLYSRYEMLGVKSEALFLRSLSYFYLVRIFNSVPLVLTPTNSDNVFLYPEKETEEKILSTIMDDLLEARKYVSDDYGSIENNRGRASKSAINALLADIALWNFEYGDCLEYINEIEENSLFTLALQKDWFTIFYDGNRLLEGIFELQYNVSQNNTLFEQTYTKNFYLASELITGSINMSGFLESDKEVTRSASYNSTTQKIWKYCGSSKNTVRPGTNQKSANWIFYRYADILLMKAEALSQLDRYDEAIEYVSLVRKRAGRLPVAAPQNPDAFEDLILTERAKELAFEGKRWFDLLRMGRRNDFKRKNDLINIMTQSIPSNQRLLYASKLKDPMSWYFPINETELENNVNLKQNPYYANK